MLKKNLPLWAFKVAAGGNRNAAEVFKAIWHWAATAETVFNRPWPVLYASQATVRHDVFTWPS